MRARQLIPVLLAFATIPAEAHAQASPADAPSGGRFVETVNVPGEGPQRYIRTSTSLDPNATYALVMKGTRTVTYSPPPEGTRTYTEDAAFCFQAIGVPCPDGNPPVRPGSGLIIEQIEPRVPMRALKYNPRNTYTIDFTGVSGPLGFMPGQFGSGSRVSVTGGFTIDLYEMAAAATVEGVSGQVVFRVPPGDFQPLVPGSTVPKGAEVRTEIDATATLKFSDGTTMTIKEMSQVQMTDLATSGQRQTIRVNLRIGEVAAEIHPNRTTPVVDFRISTPGATAGVRGTVFSVFYDAVAKATIVSTAKGKVSVDPVGRRLPTTMVTAGKELEVMRRSISRLAARGKAGARGGVNRRRARDLVAALLGRSAEACTLSIPRSASAIATRPAPGGWLVSVTVSGKAKGKAVFAVTRAKAKAQNALARKIARRCA